MSDPKKNKPVDEAPHGAENLSAIEARQLAQEAAVMAEIGRIISSTLDIEEVYELFAGAVRKILSFDRLAMNYVDLQEGTGRVTYVSGTEVPGRKVGRVFSLRGSSSGEALRTRCASVIQGENAEDLETRFPMLAPLLRAGLRSFLAVPLVHGSREMGVLHFHSQRINAYTDRDCRLAENVADQIAGAIAIAQLFAERRQMEEQIKASLREKEILLKEIHHRVKNNLQIISSLLRLQARYVKDEEGQKFFQNSEARVRTMALIHEKLYRSADLAQINLGGYIKDLAGILYRSYGVSPGTVALRVEVEDVFLAVDKAIPCGLILNELITNALKYAFPEGRKGEITITMRPCDGGVMLIVADNGAGFPEGIDFRSMKSLGMQLVISLVEQLEGDLEIHRNEGTEFRITFPQGK